MSEEELKTEAEKVHFAVMAIGAAADMLGISPSEMQQRLERAGIVKGLLFDLYEVEHTLSLKHVAEDVIEALKKEFAANNMTVEIDANNGALVMDSSVLFDYDETELSDAGKEVLAQVLPIYCNVLLDPQYYSYLAEIIIDGYTDSSGGYEYNLELSQRRSLAVAEYLLELSQNFLSEDNQALLRQNLTVNGHSSSNLVLDADGNENAEASRRVEVKFRLKDEEMIEELRGILDTSE